MKNLVLPFLLFLSTAAFAQPTVDICLVTVDTTVTHNVVVWDQVSPTAGIDSVNIYREDTPGTFNLIATWPTDSLSEYRDMTADVNLRPWAYKIAPVYTNGQEGPHSSVHQTIHCSSIDNGNGTYEIEWTQYQGHNIDVYQCWRDSTFLDNWELMFSQTTLNDTDWNDMTPPTTMSSTGYKIDVLWQVPTCNATKAVSHNTTRSNRTQGVMPSGIEAGAQLSHVHMFPNPAIGNVHLEFSSDAWSPITIQVFDLMGAEVLPSRTIKVLGQYRTSLDVAGLSPGIYMVRIGSGTSNHTERLVIQ